MTALKKRELWLVSALLGSLLITGFSLLSIKPSLDKMDLLKKEQQKVKKKLSKARLGMKSKGSLKKMRENLSQLKEEMESKSKTLEGYKQSFIDLYKNEKQAGLKSEITRLIEEEGMTILDIGEDSQSLDKLVNAQSQETTKGISRPMINLKLTGNFSMLNGFIQQLETLPYSVVITRLSMVVERQADTRAPYQLLTDLSLAL
jgi:Tfp pilus assembly protein PilO